MKKRFLTMPFMAVVFAVVAIFTTTLAGCANPVGSEKGDPSMPWKYTGTATIDYGTVNAGDIGVFSPAGLSYWEKRALGEFSAARAIGKNKVEKLSLKGFWDAHLAFKSEDLKEPTTPTTIVDTNASYSTDTIYENVYIYQKSTGKVFNKYCIAADATTMTLPFALETGDLVWMKNVGPATTGVLNGAAAGSEIEDAFASDMTGGDIYEVTVYNTSGAKVGGIEPGDMGTMYMAVSSSPNTSLDSPVSTAGCKVKVVAKVDETFVDGAASEITATTTSGEIYEVTVYNITDHAVGSIAAGSKGTMYMAAPDSNKLTSPVSTDGCKLLVAGSAVTAATVGVANDITASSLTANATYAVEVYNPTAITVDGLAAGGLALYYMAAKSETVLTSYKSTLGCKVNVGSAETGLVDGAASSVNFGGAAFTPNNVYKVSAYNTTSALIAGVPVNGTKDLYLKALSAATLACSVSTKGLKLKPPASDEEGYPFNYEF